MVRTDATDILEDFEKSKNIDPELLDKLRKYTKKQEKKAEEEDPRISFTTPEFKKASKIFTENFMNNFGQPFEWTLDNKGRLVKLETPVDKDGNPWPKDKPKS